MIPNKQFILTKKVLSFKGDAKKYKINDYYLYSNPDLSVHEVENNSFHLILIGNIFDYENPSHDNSQIISLILTQIKSISDFLHVFDNYCGSFISICFNKSTNLIYILPDAAASRELYYYQNDENEIIAASQPVTIGTIVPLESDNNTLAKQFYQSKAFNNKKTFIGDKTNFIGVKRLKPNYYLNINNCKAIRFFPNKFIQQKYDADLVAKKAAHIIKGCLEAASKRNKLAIPVTAGWESRIFLAASKNISDEVFYFVFKHENYSEKHQDIKIPNKLLQKLGLKLNILEYPRGLDKETTNDINNSFSFPRYNNFDFVVNAIGKKIPNYMVANGNISEIARMLWDDLKINNGKQIAYLQKYPNLKYAIEYYDYWLTSNKRKFKQYNYSYTDMLYWEENCGNWVAKTNSEFRYKADIFQPFNSRNLLLLLLSVDKKYRRNQNPILYKKIIRYLWNDCLSEPINPVFKKQVIRFMQILKIYGIYRNVLLWLQLFIVKNKKR